MENEESNYLDAVQYRCFNDGKDCADEMKKHSPYGMVEDVVGGQYLQILSIDDEGITVYNYENGIDFHCFSTALSYYNFMDGTKFGVKKEK